MTTQIFTVMKKYRFRWEAEEFILTEEDLTKFTNHDIDKDMKKSLVGIKMHLVYRRRCQQQRLGRVHPILPHPFQPLIRQSGSIQNFPLSTKGESNRFSLEI